MPYCTMFDVQALAGGQELDPLTVEVLLEPVSEAIDRHCRRTFTATAGSRTFDATGTDTLRLDRELCSLTSIGIDGDTYAANAFALEPRSGPPYQWVRFKDRSGRFGYQGDDVTVTGVWGYSPTVPKVVTLAASLWVLELHNTADVVGLTSVAGGGASYSLEKALDTPPSRVLALKLPRRVVIGGV